MARPEYQRAPVGECDCLECNRVAEVREDKNKNLYIVCQGGAERDGCGKLTPNTRYGQDRLRQRTRFFRKDEPEPGASVPEYKAPEAVKQTAPEPEPVAVVPETKNEPVPETPRGFLHRLLNNPVI